MKPTRPTRINTRTKAAAFWGFFLVMGAVLLLTVITNGCISTSADKKYYQLYLHSNYPHPEKTETVMPVPKIDKLILVEPVKVEDIYNDYRLVYRTSPFQLNYYGYHFWIKKPEKIVRDAIIDYLARGDMFKGVITGFSRGTPDLLLKAVVHVMEEYDGPSAWFARLKMDIEIKDFTSGKTVLFYTFDREKPLPAKSVGYVPMHLSMILKEELDNAVKQLEEELRKQ
jgi:uncharacterized lipoprotein YmbA